MRTRVFVTDAAHAPEVMRAHGEAFGAARPACTGDRLPRCSTSVGSASSKWRRCADEADLSGVDHGQGQPLRRGRQRPRPRVRQERRRTRSAPRRSTCCSTPRPSTSSSTSTPCSPPCRDTSSSRASTPELMQSVLEVATPVCRTPADVDEQLRVLRRLRLRRRARARHARRLRGHASVLALRAAAHHREGPVSRDGRPDAVHRAPRADLRAARARRRRRSREGDPGRERADRAPRGARRALGELAVLARRADGPRTRRGTWSTRRCRARARRRASENYADYAEVVGQLERTGCIADYTHIWWDIRLHPRLGTIEIRICDAVTQLEDVIALTASARRSSSTTRSASTPARRSRRTTASSTTENKWLAARYGLEAPVMDLVTGPPQPRAGGAAGSPHAEDGRAARARARLGAGARRHRGHPPPRQRRRPPAARLQREPRHRRGGARDRRT